MKLYEGDQFSVEIQYLSDDHKMICFFPLFGLPELMDLEIRSPRTGQIKQFTLMNIRSRLTKTWGGRTDFVEVMERNLGIKADSEKSSYYWWGNDNEWNQLTKTAYRVFARTDDAI